MGQTENEEPLKPDLPPEAPKRRAVRKAKPKAEKAPPKTIEETFEELEAIIGKLESGESSLEESFSYYEAGMKLVKSCNDQIDKVEKQIIILNEDGGNDEDE